MILNFRPVIEKLSNSIFRYLSANIGKNKSDRILPFKMWVNFPLSVTPYYEIMFAIQVSCISPFAPIKRDIVHSRVYLTMISD